MNINGRNNSILRSARETTFAELHNMFIGNGHCSKRNRHFLKKGLITNGPEEQTNTLNIPLKEEEVLGPTPPKHHHHISKDVHHKVDVLKWLADNQGDPALKLSNHFFSNWVELTGNPTST